MVKKPWTALLILQPKTTNNKQSIFKNSFFRHVLKKGFFFVKQTNCQKMDQKKI